MITAQQLYDRREQFGEISGTDLHEIFQAVCGDPSPAGRTPIDLAALEDYSLRCREGQNAECIAEFCEAFVGASTIGR